VPQAPHSSLHFNFCDLRSALLLLLQQDHHTQIIARPQNLTNGPGDSECGRDRSTASKTIATRVVCYSRTAPMKE